MIIAALLVAALAERSAVAGEPPVGQRLVAAYPDFLSHVDGNALVWRDGTRMVIDDGQGTKSFEQWLAAPDLKDMLIPAYPLARAGTPPARLSDPGRARNAAFFDGMYGDCRKGEVTAMLVDVVWLPRKSGQKLRVTKVNGVAGRLAVVSRELDALPTSFDRFLTPSAGAYNCRTVAGTDRVSAHGYGIAIDIAVSASDYWRWTKPDGTGAYSWRNRVPWEIVEIFERHGFIWGGKWYHYDTMHFEYRPELLGEGVRPSGSQTATGSR
jgi:hypothetical protein